MRWKNDQKLYPTELGSFNHRAEAMYRACEEAPDNFYVKVALERGLQRVSILHHKTPNGIWEKVIQVLNSFHKGSGSNLMDFMQEALKLEASWKADCQRTFLTTSNPRYMELQSQFILAKSQSSDFMGFFKNWQNYSDTLSLVHTLQRRDIKDSLFKWLNQNVNFLKEGFEAMPCISQMHQLSLIIQGNMRKYWDKRVISIVLFESLKYCVT